MNPSKVDQLSCLVARSLVEKPGSVRMPVNLCARIDSHVHAEFSQLAQRLGVSNQDLVRLALDRLISDARRLFSEAQQ